MVTRVDLLRHGEPEGGARIRGQIDDPLSALGWSQMAQSVSLIEPDWTHIISSPLVRCQAFAQRLAEQHQIRLTIIDAFQEIGFGEWQGNRKVDLDQDAVTQFYANPDNHTPPGAEPASEFYQRVTQAWQQMLTEFEGETLLLVTHAGVIRALWLHLHKRPIADLFQLKVPFAGLCQIQIEQAGQSFSPINFSQPN